ncbi:hypothetical protein NLJ89_g2361 [Agrocybe chaxingu]|uniref:GST N-terminal domain-containing protein n=1 Tax=Agrocybe chaxingu TaxID=84603 RepID=A0A9W8K7H6_9AGAR|nr:hypothetical protein NLJ89_g2361 [Agrocybe chaxingu]
MTIIFYDIPSTAPGSAWYCLNYKRIPYRTEWVEYPDIKKHCQERGIGPTFIEPGAPEGGLYTLPAIHDPSTGIYLADSLAIAEYLEKTYPDTPLVFPDNTAALQIGFSRGFHRIVLEALPEFIQPAVLGRLDPASQEFFRRTREEDFGMKLEDVLPQGEKGIERWAKVNADFGTVADWYDRNGGKGPFLLGEKLSWGDMVVAGFTVWLRIIWGEDSAEWKEIETWHNGRWKTLLDALEKYSAIH